MNADIAIIAALDKRTAKLNANTTEIANSNGRISPADLYRNSSDARALSLEMILLPLAGKKLDALMRMLLLEAKQDRA